MKHCKYNNQDEHADLFKMSYNNFSSQNLEHKLVISLALMTQGQFLYDNGKMFINVHESGR